MNQEKIGKFICEKRKEKKLTQEQLAEKLCVTNRAISNWENGKNMPDLSLFKPLCDELGITINELMSGEEIDDKHYINTFEENIVNIVSDLEKSKKRKSRIVLCFLFILCLIYIVSKIIYSNYELDVKFDSRVMTCEFIDDNIQYSVKGQSIINTYHTCRKLEDKEVCFFNSKVLLENKKRSNWEYSQSMARLLEGKDLQFASYDTIENVTGDIKVYYSNESIKTIDKASNKKLEDIINKSYLMCEK